MSICKYCQSEISWAKVGDRNVPMNADNTAHKCGMKAPKDSSVSDTKKDGSIESRKANLRALIELCRGLDPAVWPACAGVWNK